MNNNDNNLNKSRMYYAHKKGKNGTSGFNCWGATLFVLGVNDRLEWTRDYVMERFLKHDTEEVKDENDLQMGDILVMREFGRLEHTAVYLRKDTYFHKRGHFCSEITSLQGIQDTYDLDELEYRRMV